MGNGMAAAVRMGLCIKLPPSPYFYQPRLDDERISHPFYGFSLTSAYDELNAMPPRQGRDDTVVIGLLGGSVAAAVEPYLQSALTRWFAANNRLRQPAVLKLAVPGAKQPQQTLIVASALLLGGEFDLIVNLDGFNELVSAWAGTLTRMSFLSFPTPGSIGNP